MKTRAARGVRGLYWAGAWAVLLAACAGAGSPPGAASPKAKLDAASAEPKPGVSVDKLGVAAGCVTQAPEPAEVTDWRKRQLTAVSRNLAAAAACFANGQQPAYLQVELERQTPTSSDVWIIGSSLNDCTITQCVIGKLRNTTLPEQPATLPSAVRRAAQVILAFDSRRTPPLQLSPTPDVPLADGPCVDQTRLPKSGQLSPAHIRGRVREAAPKLRVCYEQGLARDPALAGKVVMGFTIAPDGSVQNVELKSNSLPDCQVVGCMSDVFRGLHFDQPQGGPVSVVYPFDFRPIE